MEVGSLRDEALFSHWMSRMPESRRKKAASFRFPEGRLQSLGVGILLYQAMERHGMDPAAVRIAETAGGQPFLPDEPAFHFSLSHAGAWAVCAVCGAPVGCDVEKSGRGSLRLAERFFHPEELEALRREAEPRNFDRLFTGLWTRKESYLKAVGQGLSLPMSSFSALSPGREVHYDGQDLAEGYAFSCCVLREERPVFVWIAPSEPDGPGQG